MTEKTLAKFLPFSSPHYFSKTVLFIDKDTTMVVHFQNTFVTYTTMMSSRWLWTNTLFTYRNCLWNFLEKIIKIIYLTS